MDIPNTLNDVEKQRILNRIRKMLTLANNAGASEGERDNALRMAHATLSKYNLDIAEAEAAGRTTAESKRVIVKKQFYGRPWARRVTSAVSEMLFCINIYTPAKKATETTHWFIGRESNAITAADLSEYLVRNVWTEAHRRARQLDMGNEYARNFATGASISVLERCRALRENKDEEQAAPVPGQALVLASFYKREVAANNQVLADMQVKTRESKSRAKSIRLGNALTDGKEYGSTLNLNRQIAGTTVPKITQE